MIELNNEKLHVEFSETGAQLIRLQDQKNGRDYLWSGDPTYWRFSAPILFPIVGRLKNDQYEHQGQTYTMHQHGFARESEFKVVEKNRTQIMFELTSAMHQFDNYPFEFILRVTYQLKADELTISYQITNPGEDELFFSIGAHPAFNVSLDENRELDHVRLSVTPQQIYDQVKLIGPYSDIQHPQKLDLTQPLELKREMFDNDALILDLQGQAIELTLNSQDNHGVKVFLDDAPYVGVWSPYPKKAPFVCIEPWWGIADQINASGRLNEKAAINQLASHASQQMQYRITPF